MTIDLAKFVYENVNHIYDDLAKFVYEHDNNLTIFSMNVTIIYVMI
jgi:hypothetical protein